MSGFQKHELKGKISQPSIYSSSLPWLLSRAKKQENEKDEDRPAGALSQLEFSHPIQSNIRQYVALHGNRLVIGFGLQIITEWTVAPAVLGTCNPREIRKKHSLLTATCG